MFKRLPKIPFYLFILLFSISGLSAQTNLDDIYYSCKKENIKILDNQKGYTSRVEWKGQFISSKKHLEYIPYSELEIITNIDPQYYNSKGKLKHLKEEKTQNSSLITSSFYDGYRAQLIDFTDKGNDFFINFDRACGELMYLSTLSLNSSIPTDTFYYRIEVPADYRLLFKFPDNKEHLSFDSTVSSGNTIYTIISTPVSKLKAVTLDNPRYETAPIPHNYIRMIALPKKDASNPWAYYNKWYAALVQKQVKLNDKIFQTFDEATVKGIVDYTKIPETVFDYVKSKISYIDIENGLGAYQPRDPNGVMLKKQGDCKDMAYLLAEILKRYGYNAHLAVSSTLSHDFDLDFPCMASANHLICVLKQKNDLVYLDATESQCRYGYPSLHIQGRNIFIIDSTNGELKKVPVVPASENRVETTLLISKSGNKLSGKVNSVYSGLSEVELKTAISTLNKNDYKSYIQHFFRTQFYVVLFDSLSTTINKDNTCISTTILSDKSIVKNGTKTFITLKFLPFPHVYPQHLDTAIHFISYQTNENKFECTLLLDEKVTLKEFNPVTYSKNGFAFKLAIKQVATDKIAISYSYKCDMVTFTKADIANFNELNKLISQTFNTAISYE